VAPEGDRPHVLLQQVPEPKQAKNRVHIDLYAEDIEAEATRLVGLGAKRLSDGPMSEHGVCWIVMADPEGNEFCVCDQGSGSSGS
jgi:predicted enzyme related to lactoylglutathione lyase